MRNNAKKNIMALSVSILILSALTGCNSDIGKDEATRIALEDAGFTESDVTRLTVTKDQDDGTVLYDVQFTIENTEYDYEIQASNGNIISTDIDEVKQDNTETQQTQTDQQAQTDQQDNTNQNDTSKNSNDQNTTSNSSTNPNVKITQEDAAKLALDRVSGSTEQDIRIQLDYDNGSYKYEGEIIYNQKEYEFEIDANTGTFLEWSEEKR